MSSSRLKDAMLACGAASTILYVAMDILATRRYRGYSYRDQTISELSAIGAPTRRLWIPLGLLYSGLVTAGGAGIWMAAAGRLRLRAVAGLVAVVGAVGFVGWPFAPMHRRQVLAAGGSTRADSIHLLLGALNSLLFMGSIALGARSFGKVFRAYSFGTIVAAFAAGAVTAAEAPRIGKDAPTPWAGIAERIAVEGSMAWIAVLCLILRRDGRAGGDPGEEKD